MAVYEIAGVRFEADISDPYTKQYIADYAVQADRAEEKLTVTEAELAEEQKLQPYAQRGVLYACALLRKLSKRMLYRYDTILLHAAALLYEGKAYLFVAPSGTGKTTHIMLWKKCLGEKMAILNGDKPFLRLQNGEITVYGSPWKGKEGYGMNASAPLGGVFLLDRAAENSVRQATVPEALQKLLFATIFPEEAEGRAKVLDFMGSLYRAVPVAMLYCNMEDDAVYTVKKFIEAYKKQ